MNSSDFRAKAREKLAGKWGKAACITLLYFILSYVLTFIDNKIDNSIFSLLITLIKIPLSYGFICSCLKLYKNEEVGALDYLSLGLGNFGRAWKVQLWTIVKLIVPCILLFIGFFMLLAGTIYETASVIVNSTTSGSGSTFSVIGIILFVISLIWLTTKSYYYALSRLIAIENPDLTAKACIEKSRELMNGKRFKLFCLSFSFIGWILLGTLVLGIGLLWVLPYLKLASIAFYFYVCGNEENKEISEEQDLNNPIQ